MSRTIGACRVLDARDAGALVATEAAVLRVGLQVDAQARAAGVSSRAHKPTLPAAVPRTKHVRRVLCCGGQPAPAPWCGSAHLLMSLPVWVSQPLELSLSPQDV